MEITMHVDTDFLKESIIAIHELTQAMVTDEYSWTMNGVMNGSAAYGGVSNDRGISANEHDFLVGAYDKTAAVLRMIWAVTGVIADGLSNEEIALYKWDMKQELDDAKKKGA